MMIKLRIFVYQPGLCGLLLGCVRLAAQTAPPAAEPATELERFITTESALAVAGDLMPTSRPVDSVFGLSQSLLDVPRSVTVLTPELLKKFGVRDFSDLPRVTAGGERPNFFGIAGSPVLRGDFAGTFFDGMQRAFQRNEMPMSFGSLEGMDIVKGPAPANYGPTQAGGYVNFLPKSPYFDKFRGSVRATIGSYNYTNTQVDVGGPFLLGRKPAAFRLSLTGQRADSYYDNVGNNYLSLYGAVKARLAESVSVFTGAEYYKFKSNENPGWNRVTQQLIDTGAYLVGDAVNATSAAAGGRVLPSAVPFVSVPAVPGGPPTAFGPSSALVPPTSFAATLPPQLRALLGPSGEYTTAYLNAGGPVAATKIAGSAVLSDPGDYADSQDLLWFFNLSHHRSPGLTLKNQTLIDWIKTAKLSSYGYAFNMEQFVLENKTTFVRKFPGRLSDLLYGGSLRYSRALQLQDFQAEPFSRRDISQRSIPPNSIVLAGPQRPLTGDTRRLWSQGADSELRQAGLFAVGRFQWGDAFSLLASLRVEGADFQSKVPSAFERSPNAGRRVTAGGKNYYLAGLNPVWPLAPGVSLYAAAQYGTALNPSQGGNVTTEANFGPTGLAEVGVKSALLDGRLYASFAAYYTTLSRFNNITNNPYGLRAKGVELELTYTPAQSFSFIATVSGRRTEQTNTPGFRFQATQDYYLPLVAGGLYAGGGANAALIAQNNPDTVFPGSPGFVANFFASYEFGPGFGLALGPTFRGSYWHNYEHTLRLRATRIWSGNLSFKRGPCEVLLQVTNLFSEDYFYGSEPTFAPNALITKAPPLEAKLNVTYKF